MKEGLLQKEIAAANLTQVGPAGEKRAPGLADQLGAYGLGGLAAEGLGAAASGTPRAAAGGAAAGGDREAPPRLRREAGRPVGAVVHLAGPSTADDPWSLAVMALLDPHKAALEGAGLDPERIAREADAGRDR